MNYVDQRPFGVITNASNGIGLELAKQFAKNGFDLIITGSTESIFEAQDKLLQYGTSIESLETNLATYAGVELLSKAIKNFGAILDVVCINNSINENGSLLNTTLRREINQINMNVISPVHLTKCVLESMYENEQGKILYTTFQGESLGPINSASKAFISAYVDSIREESRRHGVSLTELTVDEADDLGELAKNGYEATISGIERTGHFSFKNRIQDLANKIISVYNN